MEELKLTGNHLNGSRPLLTFSSNFDKDPHWKLLKELIMQVCLSLYCRILLAAMQPACKRVNVSYYFLIVVSTYSYCISSTF